MIGRKKVLAVTLARGGSQSVPKKNIRELNGKPLIAYTIEAGKRSEYVDDFVVSTDDNEIALIAEKLGVRAPFRRPPDLSNDTATSGAALKHAVLCVEAEKGEQFDYVVELMCTNPLKTTAQVDRAIEILYESGGDSVIAVTRVLDQHPARIKKIVDGRLVDFCVSEPTEARRQDLMPPAYIRCGSIYAMRRDFLVETGTRYGSDACFALEVPDHESINIDSEIDFIVAEILMSRRTQ